MKTYISLLGISLFALCLAPLTGAFALTLEDMSIDEKKASGIEKLTPEEKVSLQQWIQKAHPLIEKAPISHKRMKLIGDFEITSTVEQGLMFKVNDGAQYEITRRYKKKFANFKAGDKIRIYQTRKPIWFKFEQLASKEIIGVKKTVQVGKLDNKPTA